jgi:predicted Zn-dependent protease
VVKKALAALLSASIALSTPWAQAQVRLPSLGDSASEDLPVGAERRLGGQIMAEIKRDPAYLDDPLLLDYVRSLWRPLLEAARERGDISAELDQAFSWEIFLVQDRSVNAFALPGGYVGVHLGLMAVTATRDELAAVLAHELSHVSQRHIARGMGSASRQGALGVAAMLLGVLIAARSNNPDAAQAAIAGGQAAMIQGQLNFSRDMEREADRIGYGVFRDAGFATPGMAAMFERLDQASRLNDSGGFPYLRSHPLTGERMAEARSRMSESTAPIASRGSLHALMQGRARALMEPTADNWRRLLAQAQVPANAQGAGSVGHGGSDRAGTLYAGALAASRLGDHRTAASLQAELARTLQALGSGGDVETARSGATGQMLAAELALARGDAAAAAAALALVRQPVAASAAPVTGQRLSEAGAAQRSLLMLRSQTALALALKAREQGDRSQDAALREAMELLQTWVAEHRQDAAAWLLLGQACDALGLQLRALRAQAEARAAVGDIGAAIDRLRAAQARSRSAAAGGDFIEASIIDTRLRELQAQRRQQLAEMRAQRGPGQRPDPNDGERDGAGAPPSNGRQP